VAFGAVMFVAGVAQAQITYKTTGTVAGKTLAMPGVTEAGLFTATATINSSLSFDITQATMDFGIVDTNSGGATSTQDAAISVTANARWGITINDGVTYDPLAAQGKVTLNNTARSGQFAATLVATPDAVGTVQNPAVSQVVTIKGTIAATGPVGDVIELTDQWGPYSGNFVVVLFEKT
jgi:hypothetical protein